MNCAKGTVYQALAAVDADLMINLVLLSDFSLDGAGGTD
jgi:hypothetical protein